MWRVLVFITLLVAGALPVSSRDRSQDTRLSPNQPIVFTLSVNASKSFTVDLKKNTVADFSWHVRADYDFSVSLKDPSGLDLRKEFYFEDAALAFVARSTGIYTLTITHKETPREPPVTGANEPQQVTVTYRNTIEIPDAKAVISSRMINGHRVRIFKTKKTDPEDEKSLLVIDRHGRIEELLRSDGWGSSGFTFARDPEYHSSRSGELIRATVDRTGEGTPDVMLSHYSGGAHCCSTIIFAELGKEVQLLTPIYTGNADVMTATRNPKGGLRFKIGDDTFAYWLTCFACSPIPSVVLEYKAGQFRPNYALMKKPPPSPVTLRRRAQKERQWIGSEEYSGQEGTDFSGAFWGQMLELLYTGNEKLAWKYFDLVWPSNTKGKDVFQRDFIEQLNSSPYWKMIQEDTKKSNDHRNKHAN